MRRYSVDWTCSKGGPEKGDRAPRKRAIYNGGGSLEIRFIMHRKDICFILS